MLCYQKRANILREDVLGILRVAVVAQFRSPSVPDPEYQHCRHCFVLIKMCFDILLACIRTKRKKNIVLQSLKPSLAEESKLAYFHSTMMSSRRPSVVYPKVDVIVRHCYQRDVKTRKLT